MSAVSEKKTDERIIDLEMLNFSDRYVDVSNTHDIVENKKNKSTKRNTDNYCRLLSS